MGEQLEGRSQALHCDLRLDVDAVREMIMPRHVLNGDGAILQLADALPSWGMPRGSALVVCDRFLAEHAVLDPFLARMRGAGWRLHVYADVAGEPTTAMADDLVAYARGMAADVVVGIGGGSAMDLAKVAALLCTNDGPVLSHIGVDLPERPALPLVLVPTTTGTGAEATRVAVLSSDHGKRVISNRAMVPVATVLDALLVVGLPPSVTASTGIDALAHAVEACMSTVSTPLTASMSVRAAELLLTWLPTAHKDPDNLPARRGTLYGAYLAGVALNAGVLLGHSMAYTVANRTHLPHGVTCAMALPYCIAFNAADRSRDSDALALLLTAGESRDLGDAAQAVADFAQLFDMPRSPADVGLDACEQRPMAEECATTYARPTNPVAMTVERLHPLYEAWFANDLKAAVDIRETHP